MNTRTRTAGCRGAAPVFGLALLAIAAAAGAADDPTFGGPLEQRTRLTGDWGGARDELAKKGVTLDVDLTQVYQDVTNGGKNDTSEYGGLITYTLNVNTQKAGLWPGGFFNLEAMTNYDNNVNADTGSFIPANLAGLLPASEDNIALVNLSFMQFFSEKFGVVVGKLFGLGGDNNAFAHDYNSQFLNMGLNFNQVLDIYPISSYGGGVIFLPAEGAQVVASVIGASGSSGDNNIGDAFDNGVVAGVEGRFTIRPKGLVGHQLLGGVWSNADRLSLRQDPANIGAWLLTAKFPRLGEIGQTICDITGSCALVPQPLETEDNAWSVYYNFDQYLWNPAGHSDRGIGVFGRFGVSDGKANPIKYAYNLGISGNGIVPGRPHDSFGLAWSRATISDDFAPTLRDTFNLGLDNDDAWELYYNAALTPAAGLTLDVQYLDSALDKTASSGGLKDLDPATVLGARLYLRF